MSATAGSPPEVDLDQPPVLPPRPRRPFRAVLVGIAVVGLLAGAVLRAAAVPTPAPEPPLVVATAALGVVLISPQPSVQLEIRLANLGHRRQVADTASVSGGGVVTTSAALGLDLPPGADGAGTAMVPLRCGPGQRAGDPVAVRIHLRTAGSGPPGPGIDLFATLTGRLAGVGGLCVAADDVLPAGWREPVRVTRWSLDANQRLTLAVTDLPADLNTILAVQADGWLLPWTWAPSSVQAGVAQLHLDPPTPECRDGGVRPVIPTGFQLILPSRGGTHVVYAPIGLAAVAWLSAAYLRACPSRPDGPSAVRGGFDD